MKQVTIIDYGSGNLHSINKAFEKQAAGNFIVKVSDTAEDIEKASHIVLPGVGAFGDCIKGLKSRHGIIDALNKAVINEKKPFLGVCVGMQMLAEYGLENGRHDGLGWIKGGVIPIDSCGKSLKIPHMGWNELTIVKKTAIIENITSGDHAYFVHSYYFDLKEENALIASTDYGQKLTAIIQKENILGVQFHPEKSQETGLKLISNFLKM